jgi:hypothetical protein
MEAPLRLLPQNIPFGEVHRVHVLQCGIDEFAVPEAYATEIAPRIRDHMNRQSMIIEEAKNTSASDGRAPSTRKD